MRALFKNWKRDEGSIDFVQVVVGLIIIAAASVGTIEAMFYGYEQLDYEMRYRKALSLARSEVERIQGRIHSDFKADSPDFPQLKAGNKNSPVIWTLDERSDRTTFDDIPCLVSHGPINEKALTKRGDIFYEFLVWVRWSEPNDVGVDMERTKIVLHATMVPAAF